MNKENAHLFLPLVQALAEGKTIQWEAFEGVWTDLEEIDCVYDDPLCFRIKPEPRTFEVWLTPAGSMHPISLGTHGWRETDCERITVQEVLG